VPEEGFYQDPELGLGVVRRKQHGQRELMARFAAVPRHMDRSPFSIHNLPPLAVVAFRKNHAWVMPQIYDAVIVGAGITGW
jgi:hypothetical protein